ncbi:N-succinylarginine dihydrolase [Aurantiacibacter gangjinensis]|uniref:Succinylarginine dihydrolase n=1 Tax=Aurantiacibacter gangjinensis TaxID=502682 RepID=A0A0G9MVL3_9SPHN|nr:N-succinylarginine dihydrolase [Aurantiacibacter gangjinensis]APE26847.1 Succinylarginine dihydrolase [Aurantiacibacter gangjinensis]KLE33323.1 succinylarginine dihydrolase [Aurantiacibacter gangjinensis]
MALQEINFDGIVGPSHNYAGLSLGNLAATKNAGARSYPRAAALQGVAKMRQNMERGLAQGFLLPLPRPSKQWLDEIAADDDTDPALIAAAWSASSMWTANAATVSPAPDTPDGICKLSVANLVTMPHRSMEWPDTYDQLSLAFADPAHFRVMHPAPACFGDEGAANHMRFCEGHGGKGVEVFVYGRSGGPFPARQHEQASRTVARRHGLDPARTVFIEQNPEAIAAGAFHNDVVAVANERVLFTHARAFADQSAAYAAIRAAFPALEVVEVPEEAVSLSEAIGTYLFNSQLVTLPDGSMELVAPGECADSKAVTAWAAEAVGGNQPIRAIRYVDVRQSMANGGGPACLRLRVVADPAKVDQRFMLDENKAALLEDVIGQYWPEHIDTGEIGSDTLAGTIRIARAALLDALGITELA